MHPALTTLEHLSYVLECVALDYMGEAKTELERLTTSLHNDPSYAIAEREAVAKQLDEALSLYRERQYAKGASILSRVSRQMWKRLLSESV